MIRKIIFFIILYYCPDFGCAAKDDAKENIKEISRNLKNLVDIKLIKYTLKKYCTVNFSSLIISEQSAEFCLRLIFL
jgi:hypothetical protein